MVQDIKTGMHDYDGWFRDSENLQIKKAVIEACRGSMVEPPAKWPKKLAI